MKLRLFGLVLLVLALSAIPALAHEGREVGEYALVFGWRVEPALAGLPNGPEVSISMRHEDEHDGHEEAFPADIPVSLQAEVTFGSESRTLTLNPAWGETGHYIADLIPTLPGDYTFRIFGTIGDTAVDESFSSADGQFSSVEPATDVMFPQAGIVDVAALLARIEALEARLAALESQ
jgi:hypothetical protein